MSATGNRDVPSTISGTMVTDRPERYAKQLFNHWSSRGPVTQAPDGSLVQARPGGETITLRPAPGRLEVTVSVPAGVPLDGLAGAVKTHLERFGHRDELNLLWRV